MIEGLGFVTTAEKLEAACRQGRRRFEGVRQVEVSTDYIAGWLRRTRALAFERDRWSALIAAEPDRRGNHLRQLRVDELDRELDVLAIAREAVFRINGSAA